MTEPAADDALPSDRISDELGALAEWLTTRLAGVAELDVEREPGTGLVGAMAVRPNRRGAIAVTWEQDDEELDVSVAGCLGWYLPRTLASVEILRTVLEAAMSGAVEVRTGVHSVEYRVQLRDGSLLEAEHPTMWSWRGASWKAAFMWTAARPYA